VPGDKSLFQETRMTKSKTKKALDKPMGDTEREYEARLRSHPHLDLDILLYVQDCGDHQHVQSGLIERAHAVCFFRSRGEHETASQIARHAGWRTMAFMDEVAGLSDVVFKPGDPADVSRN
jgi:hypothetical protein